MIHKSPIKLGNSLILREQMNNIQLADGTMDENGMMSLFFVLQKDCFAVCITAQKHKFKIPLNYLFVNLKTFASEKTIANPFKAGFVQIALLPIFCSITH